MPPLQSLGLGVTSLRPGTDCKARAAIVVLAVQVRTLDNELEPTVQGLASLSNLVSGPQRILHTLYGCADSAVTLDNELEPTVQGLASLSNLVSGPQRILHTFYGCADSSGTLDNELEPTVQGLASLSSLVSGPQRMLHTLYGWCARDRIARPYVLQKVILDVRCDVAS